jgi:hypothetical protein
MLPGIAILGILSLFASVWSFIMTRNPKEWRVHWMNAFGIIDLNSTRTQRRTQEAHLVLIGYFMCAVLLLVSASCIFWVVMEKLEPPQERSQLEKDQDDTRKQMERIRDKTNFNKLR